jgi:hypothetical protein
MQGDADSFARLTPVPDNAGDVPTALASIPGLGALSATCGDQNAKAGTEDPVSKLTFSNTTAGAVNLARTIGNTEPAIGIVAPNTTSTVTIGGSNTFRITLEQNGLNSVFDGVVRQDGRNTADAQCLVYGYAQQIGNVR